MFLSDYSKTQTPNGRMFCIRFVETKMKPKIQYKTQFGFHFIVKFFVGWATEYSQTNIKIFVSNLSQIFSQTKTQNPIQKLKNHFTFWFPLCIKILI